MLGVLLKVPLQKHVLRDICKKENEKN